MIRNLGLQAFCASPALHDPGKLQIFPAEFVLETTSRGRIAAPFEAILLQLVSS
jgi:hypothetical protein